MFMLAFASVVGLVLYALRQNINLFYTPAQLFAAERMPIHRIRIGGMVQAHSVKRGSDLNVSFTITDFKKELQVQYSGVLPDLFKEGQGVVALGTMNTDQIFIAEQILAKHDENYMPPGTKQ